MKIITLCLLPLLSFANPYPDPQKVVPSTAPVRTLELTGPKASLIPAAMLRVQVEWSAGETYRVGKLVFELSGTPARQKRALRADKLGSYRAELHMGGQVFHDALGTGKEYRKLVPSLTFRFPWTGERGELKLWAENPTTGVSELVLTAPVDSADAEVVTTTVGLETRVLEESRHPNPLVVGIYGEGYLPARKERFFEQAAKVVAGLKAVPGNERFHYVAVFAPSQQVLGRATNLGPRPRPRNSFLGLYFPHWNNFGRWYHVVYPTDENKFRAGLAQIGYDYPVVLVDDREYWGVGNYMTHTALPAEASQFTYLLLHEFGHFLGLNEEYEGGGPTELEHAPGIEEPWSPNITFHPRAGDLKWEYLITPGTPLPTPALYGGRGTVGAYRGGYADSLPRSQSHKPVKQCMMGSGGDFCPVCLAASAAQLAKDAGH
jgi:hypothetical protein